MGLICSKMAAVLFCLVRDVRNGKFNLDDKFEIVNIGITTVSLYSFGSHLNNSCRAPAIASMFNSFIVFYKDFTRKYAYPIIRLSVLEPCIPRNYRNQVGGSFKISSLCGTRLLMSHRSFCLVRNSMQIQLTYINVVCADQYDCSFS
jgi:hypothetical protein